MNALKLVKRKKLTESVHPIDRISRAQLKVSMLAGMFSTDVCTLMGDDGFQGIYFILRDIEAQLKAGLNELAC